VERMQHFADAMAIRDANEQLTGHALQGDSLSERKVINIYIYIYIVE
jgi:hypothetical protein